MRCARRGSASGLFSCDPRLARLLGTLDLDCREDCPVCLGDLQSPVCVGTCQHSVCWAEALQLLAASDCMQCPVCRNVDKAGLRPAPRAACLLEYFPNADSFFSRSDLVRLGTGPLLLLHAKRLRAASPHSPKGQYIEAKVETCAGAHCCSLALRTTSKDAQEVQESAFERTSSAVDAEVAEPLSCDQCAVHIGGKVFLYGDSAYCSDRCQTIGTMQAQRRSSVKSTRRRSSLESTAEHA